MFDNSEDECNSDDGLDYYNNEYGDEIAEVEEKDPENFDYKCFTEEQTETFLNEAIKFLSNNLQVKPCYAKILLHAYRWKVSVIISKYHDNPGDLVLFSKVGFIRRIQTVPISSFYVCNVCFSTKTFDRFIGLTCGHIFCKDCWLTYFEVQIQQGVSVDISCMAKDCEIVVPDEVVLKTLTKPSVKEKYQKFMFKEFVNGHEELRFCPGINCATVIYSTEPKAKRTVCDYCKSVFCYNCGLDYHAPTDCQTIKKWFTKCEDDSETANYISAHTKDCPKCHVCIEKNGGCNHMQCYNCKYNFCWMCLGDWKAHGAEYYECSRYKDNPNITLESEHAQAREALKKYLHYYERWENHSKSLKLEAETLDKIKQRINEKVTIGSGTWIDWQHLFPAANLLAKCRYTLKFTYPYAYYLENGPRKELFEYQQAQLEAEIENLSWKIERYETTDRGDLENQMFIAEKRRITLLKDFLEL